MSKRDQEPVYSISIAAHLLKVSPRLLRSYEEAGLISPHRTAGNTRLYSDKDMKQLAVVCYLHQVKEVNMPGIKVILEIISISDGRFAGAEELAGCGKREKEDDHTTENELWEKIREIAPHLFR